ncbi:MAG: cytochrome C oxidase subunit IV family protein [Salibacteraceae bacterium]
MERDDIIEYSLHAHHSEEDGKKIRKKIFVVTALLSIITAVEVGMGIIWGKSALDPEGWQWASIKFAFIIMTLIKAGYIVMVFMHLGDERKSLRNVILIPYFIFIVYLLFILLAESTFIHSVKELMGWV